MLYVVIILGVNIIEGRGRILASLGWEIIVERVCRGTAIIHEGGNNARCLMEKQVMIIQTAGIANPLIKKYSSCALY